MVGAVRSTVTETVTGSSTLSAASTLQNFRVWSPSTSMVNSVPSFAGPLSIE